MVNAPKEQIPRVHDSCDSLSKIITWATSHPFPALVFLIVVADPSVTVTLQGILQTPLDHQALLSELGQV